MAAVLAFDPRLSGGPQSQRVKVKEKRGGGRGQHLMGGKGPCLGVQDPDSPRRLSKQTQCSERTPLDPHIHALFVPTHLCETSDA